MNKLALSLIAIFIISGCGKKEEPKTAEISNPQPTEPGAVVTFVNGQVQSFADGIWKNTELNDRLLLQDSLVLAAKSELELKPDSADVVKLSGPQKGMVDELISQNKQIKDTEVSKAITKIKKIQGTKQTLTTQTPTAVAGIRGTAGRKTVPPDTTLKDSTSQ